MTTTIAVAGKGGVGKTTIAALMIKYLAQTTHAPILAVDADPSSNLNLALGMELEWTVADVAEGLMEQVKQTWTAGGAAQGMLPSGMSKREHLDYHVRAALSEGSQFDLIAMGRGEGKGCYCAVNHHLREILDAIGKQYAYVVMDNEAGLEHLSRRTTRDVQHLVIVSDPTVRGLVAAGRVAAFRKELDIHIEHAYLILNRQAGPLTPILQEQLCQIDVPLLGSIPPDETISEFDSNGRPIIQVSEGTPVYKAVANLVKRILKS